MYNKNERPLTTSIKSITIKMNNAFKNVVLKLHVPEKIKTDLT